MEGEAQIGLHQWAFGSCGLHLISQLVAVGNAAQMT